jgi:hypothetical protein
MGAVQTHLLEDKANLSKLRRLIRSDLVKAGAAPSTVFDCLVAISEVCAASIAAREEVEDAGSGPPTRISWVVRRSDAEFRVQGLVGHPHLDLQRRIRDALGDFDGLGVVGDDVLESLMDEVRFEEGKPDVLVLRKRLR